jgi:hypothetical protein
MNLKLAVLALFLSSGTMYADTITVNLGQSNEIYTLDGTGGSGGYGTYLAQQGDCTAGVSRTTCTLSGTYSGTTSGYSSGTYSLITSYDNSDGGLPAISQTMVSSPSGGNYFVLEPFASDVMISVTLDDILGTKIIPIVMNGTLADVSLLISGVNPTCANLPTGVTCTQGNVGLNSGSSIFSQSTGSLIFNTPIAPAPEPDWLALGGLLPGAFFVIRHRFIRTA